MEGLSSGQSFIWKVFHYGSLSSGQSFIIMKVFHHDEGLSSGQSFIMMKVSHLGSLSSPSGWSFIRVVSHQGGLSSGLFYQGGLSILVFSSLRVITHRVVSHQDDLTAGWFHLRVVSHQGRLLYRWPLIQVASSLLPLTTQGGLLSGILLHLVPHKTVALTPTRTINIQIHIKHLTLSQLPLRVLSYQKFHCTLYLTK